MEQEIALSWKGIAAAYLLLIPALLLIRYYKLDAAKEVLFSVLRMSIQLFLVGIYLNYIFLWNHWAINLLWVLVMIAAAGWTTIRQAKLPVRSYFFPVFTAFLCSFLSVLFYFVILVIGKSPSAAAVFLPVAGMLLGNSMRSNVIVLQRFSTLFRERTKEYQLRLMLGATDREALEPFLSASLKAGIAPQIATMATLGIVSLPGMMTGQLLGGSTPVTAIEYQIVIMIGIFVVQLFSSAFLLHRVAGQLLRESSLP